MSDSEVEVDTSKIPMGAKAGGAAAGGAGFLALVYKFRNEAAFLAILLIGIVFVIMLLLGYKYFIEWRDKKKGKAFGGGLGQGAGARPAQVTASEQRVLLDDLRKKFQEGLKVFESTGKSVYRLPWYLVVGEPGSGKSRMIERSGVPGPSRLKDPVEGAGGTINMNWWFRNEAVMLDTAGRLMMPEVATAESPEWDNFLQLLDSYRPHCPVNGLFLVIPADTLVTDSAEKLDGKARQIAQQFDRIQTALGIRFPVYVVITKCDKINGFRHFFEGMNQPEEQSQMIGWSNPAPLDEAFQPELVEQHLEGVRQRLVKRRLKLLEDPIHRGDPTLRRLDEVDSLYLFPDNLASLGKRLRRYLEAIFVAGEWSSMPLFLRGIYFTSALQKGGVVDKALSDALGVDVAAALGEDKESETPYFLRDLFMEKSFKEKGLVTRASNVDKLKRRRKLTLIGAAFAAAIAFGGFMWFGRRQLETSVGEQQRFWTAVQSSQTDLAIVRDGKYQGRTELAKGLNLRDVHDEGPKSLTKPITIPAVYRPVAFVSGDPNQIRPEAYRALFQTKVLVPLVDAARKRIKEVRHDKWNEYATDALRQLLWIESGQPFDASATASGAPLRPLFNFVLRTDGADAEQVKQYEEDHKVYEEAFAAVYKNGEVPPAGALGVGLPPSTTAVTRGVDTFLAHWEWKMGDARDQLDAFKGVADALVDFRATEKALVDLGAGGGQGTSEAADAFFAQWTAKNQALTNAKGKLDAALANKSLKSDDKAPLSQQYQRLVESGQLRRRDAIKELLKAFPQSATGAEKSKSLAEAYAKLAKAQGDAEAAASAAGKEDTPKLLAMHEKSLLESASGLENQIQRRYEIHYEVVQRSANPRNAASGDKLDGQIESIRRAGKEAQGAIASLAGKADFAADADVKAVCEQAIKVARLGEARALAGVVGRVVGQMPKDGAGWGAEVQGQAGPTSKSPLPFTEFDGRHDAKYDPAGAQASIEAIRFLKGQMGTPAGTEPRLLDADALQRDLDKAERAWGQYLGDYRNYWEKEITGKLGVRYDKWAVLHQAHRRFEAADVHRALLDLAKRRVDAFKRIGDDTNAQAANDAVTALNQAKLVNGFARRLSKWKGMPDSLDAARDQMLSLTWKQLTEDYLMESPAVSPSFAEVYWQNVCRAGLLVIAGEVEREANGAVAELMGLRHFPLAPLGAGDKRELTRREVDRAGELIRTIRGTVGDKPAGSIAKEMPTEAGDLAGPIAMLKRGARLEKEEDQRWVDQVQGFLEARAAGVTWTVRMQPPDETLGGRLRFGIYYVRLNAKELGRWLDVQTGVSEFKGAPDRDVLTAPDEPVFTNANFDVILQGTVESSKANPFTLAGEPKQGDWAVCKFLGTLKQLQRPAGAPWTAQIPITRQGMTDLYLPVTITFSRNVEWPSLPPSK